MLRKFRCIQDCSDCCIYREYYPSVPYGKIGVLLLPREKPVIEEMARKENIDVRIVPRLAAGKDSPETIIAYQMMGKSKDGDLCPFLDVENPTRSPHGGYRCRIYPDRPQACRAYPVIETFGRQADLDGHCQFCSKFSTAVAGTASVPDEVAALENIRNEVRAENGLRVWRYATATGRPADTSRLLPEGWVSEP